MSHETPTLAPPASLCLTHDLGSMDQEIPTMTLSITLPSGDVGTIRVERYPYATRDGHRIDIWAASADEAATGAKHYGRAIEATLYPDDGTTEPDATISTGVVWSFGRPDHPNIRHRLGLNVYVG